ncbi:hypothetical protein [Nocardioides marmoribigeumensis]|uniref:Uncharacterized protein n=1 Tax=Nocardioides marmoribigeumensis TaxID=433649 RepID=A0ABU2C085_9ACTN|nr:hypothetical protein [Nocardioides marmoribigeumensis]MDR7364061.1 hypothetical protein [Nocardioides marmoribigeumensis]
MSAVACQVCGLATDQRPERRLVRTPAGVAVGQGYEVGTCDDCAALDPARPGLAVRAALRVLGKEEADDVLAAKAFEEAGVDVTEVLYDRGDDRGGRGARGPQRKAFAHVGADGLAALRLGYAKVLDMRVHAATRDRAVPPTAPPEGHPPACVACGVARSAGWATVRTKALTRGPDFLDGCVCSTCAEVLRDVGAVGATFLERAAMQAKGIDWVAGARVPGLQAWVATGLPPGEPWGWVDLALPEPEMDPLALLRSQVADLQREVAVLREAVAR